MQRYFSGLIGLLLFSLATLAQTKQVLPLWPDGAKESNGITEPEETVNVDRITNISEATITVQLPDSTKATGAAVIICPGGGYAREAISHEGFQFADWLNQQGIAGIVLKYRLPNGHKDIPLADAKRAVQMVRAYAKGWNIDTGKVAIAGFSAGGHLASTLGTHFDNGNPKSGDAIERYSNRPNMMLLFYPVISMKNGLCHAGSREKLLGVAPTDDEITFFSNELQVKDNTPPTILFLSNDDKTVPPLNSVFFYEALKTKNIPASLNIYPTGGHGWGMRTNIAFYNEWRTLLLQWFRQYGYIK